MTKSHHRRVCDAISEGRCLSPNSRSTSFLAGSIGLLSLRKRRGFFATNGIEVTLQSTPNSVAQMTGLSEGKFQIAMTAVDNIVAYVEGQGEAPIGPQPEFFAFMGSDSGFLSLVTRPEIMQFSDLKSKTLSVDARTTGYAFVLFDMLRRGGLAPSD